MFVCVYVLFFILRKPDFKKTRFYENIVQVPYCATCGLLFSTLDAYKSHKDIQGVPALRQILLLGETEENEDAFIAEKTGEI